MILKYKNSALRAQLKLKSGIFCSDPPNFVSHNSNLNVKKGYTMVQSELRWCHIKGFPYAAFECVTFCGKNFCFAGIH